jgi:hypothetical protein
LAGRAAHLEAVGRLSLSPLPPTIKEGYVPTYTPRLSLPREEIDAKFEELIEQAESLHKETGGYDIPSLVRFREVRVSALNLLARLASPESTYYEELRNSEFTDHLALHGILLAARTDFAQGFMADARLLISAEVFSDILIQADILLENEYVQAAAVVTRAVLEDALRRLATARRVPTIQTDTIGRLNENLYMAGAYTVLQQKEITAKAQIGNDAAHGHTEKYTRPDVAAFLEFTKRFLAEYLV